MGNAVIQEKAETGAHHGEILHPPVYSISPPLEECGTMARGWGPQFWLMGGDQSSSSKELIIYSFRFTGGVPGSREGSTAPDSREVTIALWKSRNFIYIDFYYFLSPLLCPHDYTYV